MDRPARSRVLTVLVLAVATLMLATGCGGSTSEKSKEKSPAEVMATAKQKIDEASSVHMMLSTDSTPTSGNGVLGATGDVTQEPAFEGDVKVVLNGLTATIPVTSTGGKVYAKLPLQTKFAVIDPAEYGAPDPADFADPDAGLSGLLTKLEDLKKGDRSRSADTILTSYTGALPGTAVKGIIPSAAAKQSYATKVGIDEKGYATTLQITGSFFNAGGDVTYDIKLDDYDKGVTVTAPAL